MKVIKNLVAALSGIAALIAVAAIILVLLGYRPFVLMSGSMEPLYSEGSLCFVNTRILLDDLSAGDVLVYRESDFLVLHRLVGIEGETDGVIQARLQGDTNNIAQDVELSSINYVGREAFTIPALGAAVEHIPSALIWSLAAVFIILACIPWASLIRRKKAAA